MAAAAAAALGDKTPRGLLLLPPLPHLLGLMLAVPEDFLLALPLALSELPADLKGHPDLDPCPPRPPPLLLGEFKFEFEFKPSAAQVAAS
jgi:hypothetical protein